ncbi:amidohydrolase [Nonomuraea sp. NPDC050536]|uniref:amidohydrolase n=1 Tax=Nonomuraea sp. NPDC050536 TaxID=3364366 RepID=UPI0037C6747C
MDERTQDVLRGLNAHLRADLEDCYRDLHANPELSFTETQTADKVAKRLAVLGVEVATGIGRTGVVGLMRNGPGPTVLLRADMDALPVRERTGLPYASMVTALDQHGNEAPVMHACGHDMHVTCLLGALTLLAGRRDLWSGTVMAVFQPGQEAGAGAKAMVADGLYDRFGKPEVVLGQHVTPIPAGRVAYCPGDALAATDALRVRLFGRGGHASMPERTVDPVVMAAAIVMRLQTVVSREIAGTDTAVVTVGALNAGGKDNVIPDEAELLVTIRTYAEDVRSRVLAAVRRIVEAEAFASGATLKPDISTVDTFPVLRNDPEAISRTADVFRSVLGPANVAQAPPSMASEDIGDLATPLGIPLVYWYFGGADPAAYAAASEKGTVADDIPTNHSPAFAPVISPTLEVGTTTMTTAALHWLRTP